VTHNHCAAADIPELTQVPAQFRTGTWVPLTQGLTNRCYRLVQERQSFFVRWSLPDALLPGIHRSAERVLLQTVARVGLYPSIRYQSPDSLLLITDWCPQPCWTMRTFRSVSGLQQLGKLVAHVHQLSCPDIPTLDLPAYLAELSRRLCAASTHATLVEPQQLADGLSQLNDILSALVPVPLVLCHNDIHPGNLLGEQPWLIDWEYAHYSDPAFELAGICLTGELDGMQQELLCHSYLLAGGHAEIERIRRYLPVVAMICYLWAETLYRTYPDGIHQQQRKRYRAELTRYDLCRT
jgi:thiamine kinase